MLRSIRFSFYASIGTLNTELVFTPFFWRKWWLHLSSFDSYIDCGPFHFASFNARETE